MLALIKEGEIVDVVTEGAGFSHGEEFTMPAEAGWSLDGFELKTVLEAVPVPPGKVSTGQAVQLVNGFPQWVNTLEDAPPAPREMVLKSVVQGRIIEAGKMGDAFTALTTNPIYFARWFAPDRPSVYRDDPDAVLLVTALGLDPAIILAPNPN